MSLLRIPLLVAGAGLAACASALSLPELDALARQVEARTIVLEEDVSIYSPYDLATTREYLDLVRAERDLVFALLDVPAGEPIVVWLRPDDGVKADFSVGGGGMRVNSISISPRDHILGQADGEQVQIRVGLPTELVLEDGSTFFGSLGASMYAETVRHELTHVAITRLGLSVPSWLSEGFAHAVEWIPIEAGRFAPARGQSQLRAAAALPAETRSLDALLAWRQTLPVRLKEDSAARHLALAFVVFVCETQDLTVRAGLLRLAELEPDEVRDLEDAWSAWLARYAES
jgi:hypothetical protein